MSINRDLGFRWHFLRARLKEILWSDYAGSASLLAVCEPPSSSVALRDAYRLRMLVLASEPEEGQEILEQAHNFAWFSSPSGLGEEYAATYCRYMIAAMSGDISLRRELARRLQSLPVASVYREALKVTI